MSVENLRLSKAWVLRQQLDGAQFHTLNPLQKYFVCVGNENSHPGLGENRRLVADEPIEFEK